MTPPPRPPDRSTAAVSRRRSRSPSCARSTCSTTSTMPSSQRWVDVAAAARRRRPATIISEQGQEPPGLHLLLERRASACFMRRRRAHRAGRPPARRRPGSARSPLLTGGTGERCACRSRRRRRFALDRPRGLHRAGVPAAARCTSASCARSRPVVSRIDRDRAEPRAARVARARWPPGLAHELNNPAAAAQRAAADTGRRARRARLDDRAASSSAGVERERRRAAGRAAARGDRAAPPVAHARSTRSTPPTPRTSCSSASRSSASPEPWRLAEPLAAAGVGRDWLDARAPRTPARRPTRRSRWIAASLTARSLAAELAESTQQMSRLVGAVKSYAYMDRGELVEADVHEGLETTLTVLGHKLKHTDDRGRARLRPDAARSSRCAARSSTRCGRTCSTTRSTRSASTGTITITTAPRRRLRRRSTSPTTARASRAEVRERVFDPFFTTKDGRPGHRPRPRHRAPDRRRPPRRLARRRVAAGRHDVHRAAAAARQAGASLDRWSDPDRRSLNVRPYGPRSLRTMINSTALGAQRRRPRDTSTLTSGCGHEPHRLWRSAAAGSPWSRRTGCSTTTSCR